ncbi:MAG: EAL domain-containing protein, partial [Bradyrhizobium sp.]
DEGSMAIVRAIANLGVSFGITTTAEGVETEEQVRCLNLQGCVEVQGYFYSKPVPGSEITALLARLSDRSAQAGTAQQ